MKKQVELKLLLLTLVCVPLVFNLFFILLMLHLLDSVDVARSKHVHALNVGILIGDYGAACLEGSTYAALSRSKDKNDRLIWWGLMRKMAAAKANVMNFVKDDKEVRNYLENFDFLYQRSRRRVVHSNRQMEKGLRQQAIDERISSIDANNATLQAMSMKPIIIKEFETASAEEIGERKQQDLIQVVIISCAFLSVAIAGALMYLINKRIVSRSRHLAEMVNRIAAGENLDIGPAGDDEFSRTEKALYDMSVTLSQARERERAVFENAGDVIFQLDNDFKILRINSACRSVWGYEEQSLVGESIFSVILPKEVAAAKTFFAGCVDAETEKSFETRLKSADGRVLYAAISASFSRANKSLFCMSYDITEKKTIELQKEELLASLSHDVRTPITSVQITLALLEKAVFGEVPPSCSAKLEAATLKSANSIDLISDFLDLEKLAARKSKPDIQVLNLEDLVDDAKEAVELGLTKKRLTVEKKSLERVRIYVDKQQYGRVLRSLLKYFVGAAPEDSQIKIDSQLDRERVVLRIFCANLEVADEFKSSLQTMQTTRWSTKTLNSAGLSFALLKEIVENHGNSFSFEFDDKGCFAVKLVVPGSQMD